MILVVNRYCEHHPFKNYKSQWLLEYAFVPKFAVPVPGHVSVGRWHGMVHSHAIPCQFELTKQREWGRGRTREERERGEKERVGTAEGKDANGGHQRAVEAPGWLDLPPWPPPNQNRSNAPISIRISFFFANS